MKGIIVLFMIVILIFSLCSCARGNDSNNTDVYANNSSIANQDGVTTNNAVVEEKSFKNFIVSELKKRGYSVEWGLYGYNVSLLDAPAIYADDLYFYGPGSLVADNIDGCSLNGDKNSFSKDNQYKNCCNALFEMLNIDDTIDNVLLTFDEQTQRRKTGWYQRNL